MLRYGAVLAVLIVVGKYLVVPQLVGASRSVDLLAGMEPGWVVAGVLLEAAALSCYALLTRTVLPGEPPRVNRLFRITLASTGASHAIPGGAVAGSGVAVQLLTAEGVAPDDAGFVVAAEALWSAVVLNVLLWCALLASIPLSGFQPLYVVVAVIGLVAIAGAAGVVYTFTRGQERAVRTVRWLGDHLRGVGADRLEQAVRQGGEVVRRLAGSRGVLGRATVWAVLNWLLDAASLAAFLAALGHSVHPVELIVAYGIGNVLAAAPVVPGGLGIVEASTASLLTGFGLPAAVATLGVLGWRLVNFWLPIPVGAVAYASLRMGGRHRSDPSIESTPARSGQSEEVAAVVADEMGTPAPPAAERLAGRLVAGTEPQPAAARTTAITALTDLGRVDLAVYQAVAGTPTPSLDGPMRRLSEAANRSRLWLGIAAVLAAAGGRDGRRAAGAGVAALALDSAMVNIGFKLAARRRRPDRDSAGVPVLRRVPMPDSASFPSGHTASGFAFADAVGQTLPTVAAPLRLLASVVGYSRVHTGVHYPGDVILGALIGSSVGELVGWSMRRASRTRTARR